MSQMIIRPPQFYADPLGNPATEFEVYIGKPNLDPTQPANQLDITDLDTGEVVSNPYFINVDGYPKNSNGQKVTPVIQQQDYSMRFQSKAGGSSYEFSRLIGDALSGGGAGTGGIPDVTLNNLQQGLGQDLGGANYVFIKAENPSWEGTPIGADVSSFYYRDGTVDIPSAGTGDVNQWFDAAGVRYTLAKSVQEQVNESVSSQNLIDVTEIKTKTDLISPQFFLSSDGTGNNLPSGWSSSRTSLGVYTVTNLSNTNDVVLVGNGQASNVFVRKSSNEAFGILAYDSTFSLVDDVIFLKFI